MGRKMRFKFSGIILAAGFLLSSSAAAAADIVGTGRITFLENGWYGEGLALHHSGPGIAGCPGGPAEFAIDKNHPAFKEMVAIALAAFSSSSDVELVVEKGACIFGDRTKVVAIRVKK